MSEWLPIEEAPKDGRYLLLWGPNMKRIQTGRWHQPANQDMPGFWSFDGFGASRTATHFMYLPEPPS